MLLPDFGDGRGIKLLLPDPAGAPSACLADSSIDTDSTDPAPPPLSSSASYSPAACTALMAAADPAVDPLPTPLPPAIEPLRLPNLEEAAAGAARREEGAPPAAPGTLRGIPDDAFRGSLLPPPPPLLAPPVAFSIAAAAEFIAAAVAAACARLAAAPLPPIEARWVSPRPSRPPDKPDDDDDSDALRGETVRPLARLERASATAPLSSWPSPLSKLSSLCTPKPEPAMVPSLDVRPRASCREGRGDSEPLARRGEASFCRCADNLARSEDAETVGSARRDARRLRDAGKLSGRAAAAAAAAGAVLPRLPALLAGEKEFIEVVVG